MRRQQHGLGAWDGEAVKIVPIGGPPTGAAAEKLTVVADSKVVSLSLGPVPVRDDAGMHGKRRGVRNQLI